MSHELNKLIKDLNSFHQQRNAGQTTMMYLFLCGFRPNTMCAFDQDSRCQPVQVGACSGFTSTAFQEFGLTQVFAQACCLCSQTSPRPHTPNVGNANGQHVRLPDLQEQRLHGRSVWLPGAGQRAVHWHVRATHPALRRQPGTSRVNDVT